MNRALSGRSKGRFAPFGPPLMSNVRQHKRMLQATCHCGVVKIQIPRRPRNITNCDCSICRRYGPLWAYYNKSEVAVFAAPGATSAYSWGSKTIQFIRCATCGCVTHWEPIVAHRGERMGVNIRNFEPGQIGPARIRLLDGAVTEKYTG
jgi:hypothetical protein